MFFLWKIRKLRVELLHGHPSWPTSALAMKLVISTSHHLYHWKPVMSSFLEVLDEWAAVP